MSYVIYHKESTVTHKECVSGRAWFTRFYETERGARSVLTRLVNAGKKKRGEWAVMNTDDFRKIEKSVTKRNLMSGGEFKQPINTPLCCDPSSETYWCM
jgi:hypothetical protein